MWKKALAILCIPVVLLLALSIPSTFVSTLGQLHDGAPAAFRGGYLFGMALGFLLTAAAIFFLSRWIIRTLGAKKAGTSAP